MSMREYIENITINIIEDNDKAPWLWYRGQYYVSQSYVGELLVELSELMNEEIIRGN